MERRILKDDKIILRPLEPADAELLFEAIIESVDALSPWLSFIHPRYSIKETREWLSKRNMEWENGIAYDFAIFDSKNGRLLGGCGMNDVSDKYKMANIGYWVRTSEIGRGIAPAATRLLAKFAFENVGLNRIEITVDVDNIKSQRAAEKAGAKREGILRNRICFGHTPRDIYMISIVPHDLSFCSA